MHREEDSFDIDLMALREVFQLESGELLASLEEAILALESNPADSAQVEVAFRAAHNLKGNARIVCFDHMAEYTHVLEDVLDCLRRGRAVAHNELITLLLRAVDALREMIPAAIGGATEMQPAHLGLMAQLAAHRSMVPEAAEPVPSHLSFSDADQPDRAPVSLRSTDTLRVSIHKLDRIMDLVGEIAIARGRVAEMLENDRSSKRDALEAHQESDRLYLDLQELVMKMRMVPIGPLFREHVRAARDLSTELCKQVRLTLEGEEVEVDTTVVSQLRDPLTHLMRNALHHGIEEAAFRLAAGKPAEGAICLRAFHDAGTIVVEIADDGAGLDPAEIRRRAVRAGLLADGEPAADDKLFRLIMEPGFSTADEITEISGRGVGLDVVRRNVESLRGTVSIKSERGRGTTITLRLPLTLAVIDGFRVGVGNETYVVPLESVVECLELPEEAKGNGESHGVLRLRDKPVPFLRIRQTFELGGQAPERESILVVRHAGLMAGLAVDELHGAAQTVVKPLGKLFQGLPGLTGTAILGSGRVAFVLDVPGLLTKALRESEQLSAERRDGFQIS